MWVGLRPDARHSTSTLAAAVASGYFGTVPGR